MHSTRSTTWPFPRYFRGVVAALLTLCLLGTPVVPVMATDDVGTEVAEEQGEEHTENIKAEESDQDDAKEDGVGDESDTDAGGSGSKQSDNDDAVISENTTDTDEENAKSDVDTTELEATTASDTAEDETTSPSSTTVSDNGEHEDDETVEPEEDTTSSSLFDGETEEDTNTATSSAGGDTAKSATTTAGKGETASSTQSNTTNKTSSEGDTDDSSIGATSSSSIVAGDAPLEATTATATTSENPDDDVPYESTSSTTPSDTLATTTASTTTTIDPTGTSSDPLTLTTIESGSAIALANILNIVNTSFINSEGVVVFKNFFETLLEDLDLREFYNSLKTAGCSLIACASEDTTLSQSNDAQIDNNLTVEAISGRNTIDGADDATISTGDAYAGVNLINVANTTVVDSNYLLVTVNAFKGADGDIIFPSLSSFFSQLGGAATPSAIDIENAAAVNNNVSTNAQTGSNSITDSNNATIATGTSTSATNVFNQLNTSLVGNQNISILFRVHGNWAGEIFGAPPGLAWMDDGQGGIYLFDKTGGMAGGDGGSVNVHASNTALINNNVNVVALTGENAISGANTALISTGNAYAGANIMNIANATVVGKNWILAIVNILGDFNGNIAFGRPDLWVGAKADVPSSVKNGSEVTYTFTVINNGDSPATNVVLTNEYDADRLALQSGIASSSGAAGEHQLKLPDLDPGEATEVRYTAVVQNAGSGEDIVNTVSVRGRETDNNMEDNSDELVITTKTNDSSTRTGVRLSLASGNDTSEALARRLDIDRFTASSTVVRGGEDFITQQLRITNTSSRILRDVILYDTLYNPQGQALKSQVWEIGNIAPYEQIDLSYEVRFGVAAPLGNYGLRTKVVASGYEEALTVRNGTITVIGAAIVVDEPKLLPLPIVMGAFDTRAEEASTSIATPTFATTAAVELVVEPAATVPPFNLFGLPLANAAAQSGMPTVPAVPAWFSLVGLLLALLGFGILYRHFR